MPSARLTASGVALALVLAPAVASAAGPQGPGQDAHDLDLTLLATTDMHGRVLNWDYFKDATYTERSGDTVGLAKVASVVDQVRTEVGDDSLLVVDNGDAIQGTPLTYYYAKVEPVAETGEDHPMATAYNQIGYDAQVVGNHEFNYGLDHLRAYEGDLAMPLLGANVVDAQTGEPWLEPWTMVTKKVEGHKPVKVGILGLTTPGSAIWDKGVVEGTLEFRDMVETAAEYVPQMRAAGADVVVVLSHAGKGPSSYDTSLLPPENPSDVIARTVPGIDVMVVGHTHRDVPQEVIHNEVTGEPVLLTQPYRWGGTVTRVDLDLEKSRGQWDVKDAAGMAYRTRDFVEDPAVVAAAAQAHGRTVDYVNQVVATATEEMSGAESFWKDTAIVDFIQHVQTETVDQALEGTAYADVPVLSIAAPFSRTALFPAGDVTIRDMAGLYIYDNTLEAVTMTGAQVRDYLEYSAKYFATVPAGESFDPASDVNADGTPDYNYDMLSGVSYELDLSQPVGDRVENLALADGTPVTDDMEFVVAVNNYRRSGGGAFPHVSTAPVVYNEQQEIRQLLIDWASARGVIDPADFSVENWWLTVADVPVAP
ncbi:bifunctional metallophosphatase/5'-nucleotidase [Ornithinimicrobium tianjinense]|uniref:Multifunctional 2',3'-cyclic-nucleotide 2'-phosphodiesterase/5'-nucleotidase/3'-nucleotidase n=1 Tax=Ornithinimicrobium tianjinense TaxID=1195761 RepID=A0A917BFN2_9MICO|nr:5'-nucleotidase C-terminal domain-containing protein [Ornithinimicrobium tianjinense]GGF40623.1 multifunctional 2',3'-cyclic-nucleotide 2'-phosphodiesterase/5'-nucleotidase/3'-nucleotidase [Ornithinimicrobium tianjinense]